MLDYTWLVMPSLRSDTVDFGPSDFFSDPFEEQELAPPPPRCKKTAQSERVSKPPSTTTIKDEDAMIQKKELLPLCPGQAHDSPALPSPLSPRSSAPKAPQSNAAMNNQESPKKASLLPEKPVQTHQVAAGCRCSSG